MSETQNDDMHIPVDPFVAAQLKANDEQYGDELRAKYGDELISQSTAFMSKFTQGEFEKLMDDQFKIYAVLASMKRAGEGPRSDVVQEMTERHLRFLEKMGDYFNIPAYRGLGESYVNDERFEEFFEQFEPGMAAWFNEAIQFYCDNWEYTLDDTERVMPDHKAQM